ncbi:hypothetical protein C2S52_013731 [Perilla frutescens var. hirtella]|nr:hypothetical protein C2S51_016006 [Perilla frutescens var. frutescens]KAH6776170.1 hypothetical protein C2S52_013731 [Perilla frutescens var. hirtella]
MEKLKSRLHLPEDIIAEEILPRLPVKSVLRLRCVSKAWRCIIGSERFMKIHLQSSAKSKARGSVICGCVKLHHFSVEWLLKEAMNCRKLSVPMEDISVVDGLVCTSRSCGSLLVPMMGVGVVGCCNGLVCMKSKSRERIFLWNPSTRMSKELPIGRVSVSRSTATGFGFSSSYNYKVCVFGDSGSGSGQRSVFEVYSSKTNSWKTMDNDLQISLCGEGQFVSGKIHWIRGRMSINPDIVSLDLKSEVFGVMEQPLPRGHWCDGAVVLLGVLEGCLCLVSTDYEKRLDVWVRKEEDHWFHMVAAVSLLPGYKRNLMRYQFPDSFLAPPNGQIWLGYGSGYLAYDPKHKLLFPFKRIQGGSGFFKLHLCLETLATL